VGPGVHAGVGRGALSSDGRSAKVRMAARQCGGVERIQPRPPLRPDQARRTRVKLLALCREIRSLCPGQLRLALILDNLRPHLVEEVCDWTQDHNVELACTVLRLLSQSDRGAQFKASPSTAPSIPDTQLKPVRFAAKLHPATTTQVIRSY
jgi:hypothetical protein